MCKFFSCVSDGKGNVFYLNAEQRKEVKGTDINPDSHSSIVEYYKKKGLLALKADTDDKLNKYEYRPLTQKFIVDQLNTMDDRTAIDQFCRKLDFETIVPELIVKTIINPFEDIYRLQVSECVIKRLKQWSFVHALVMTDYSARFYYDTVLDSLWYPVLDSLLDSILNTVLEPVLNTVLDSVRNSVQNSVWNSVRAYASSFFVLDKWQGIEHEPGVNPFQCCIDLWESGIVPSFDGNMWRLHGHKGKIVFEIKQEDLEK